MEEGRKKGKKIREARKTVRNILKERGGVKVIDKRINKKKKKGKF